MTKHESLGTRLRAQRARGEKAFVAYLVAGDPDLAATEQFIKALAQGGTSVIELGIPFSDPLADGPVNQRSTERALAKGTTLTQVLALCRKMKGEGLETPLLIFTYFNPIFRLGIPEFVQTARESGVDAVLIVDLPPDEPLGLVYREAMKKAGLDTVFLAAPTTHRQRVALIDEASTGFLYYVSRTGVTGVQSEVSASLGQELRENLGRTANPIMVGFGIGNPEHAREVAAIADGVVVGSAIVRLIEQGGEAKRSVAEVAEQLESFARGIVDAIANMNQEKA